MLYKQPNRSFWTPKFCWNKTITTLQSHPLSFTTQPLILHPYFLLLFYWFTRVCLFVLLNTFWVPKYKITCQLLYKRQMWASLVTKFYLSWLRLIIWIGFILCIQQPENISHHFDRLWGERDVLGLILTVKTTARQEKAKKK